MIWDGVLHTDSVVVSDAHPGTEKKGTIFDTELILRMRLRIFSRT